MHREKATILPVKASFLQTTGRKFIHFGFGEAHAQVGHGSLPSNTLLLSPGAEDVCSQADAAATAGLPGLCIGFSCGVWHGRDPLWWGAGGHAAVRLRGQGLLLQ